MEVRLKIRNSGFKIQREDVFKHFRSDSSIEHRSYDCIKNRLGRHT